MKPFYFFLIFLTFIIFSLIIMGLDGVFSLLHDTFRSFLRMIIAYIFSLIFSYIFGILIIHNSRAYEIVFPILNVFQSIPILGFFPFALLFFVKIFPGGILGQELTAIFLIFTSMTWAIVFGVIESGASLSNELRDLAKILKLRGFQYLTHIVFPLTFPQFVSASITAWGGGWYFLVAAEYLSLGEEKIDLPGLGTFIAKSAFSYNLIHSLIGLMMLALIVYSLNVFVWQPLLYKATLFSGSYTTEGLVRDSPVVTFLEKIYEKIKNWMLLLHNFSLSVFKILKISPWHYSSFEKIDKTLENLIIFSLCALFFYFLFAKKIEMLESNTIFLHIIFSILHIFIAFILALFWTLLLTILIGRNKKIVNFLMPLLDIAQSIPAVSIFPIIVIILINTLGNFIGFKLSLEIASIILVMTGMQWYLLFNLIRAVQTIPDNVIDTAILFKLSFKDKLIHLFIPAIMPAILVGGLQAVGGGWNALIVSEYIISPEGEAYEMYGLGYLLSKSSSDGDFDGMMVALTAMMLLVLIPHKFLWKPLIRESYKYKF